MVPHLIATLKAEETLFSLLIQIQKHLTDIFNVLQKLRCFFHEIFKLLKAPRCSKVQTSDFVARMDILSCKLEVCLPLAYPSTIYKHFFSLILSNVSEWQILQRKQL